jgi:hypothetical protein
MNVPEDRIFHNHCCENLRSYIEVCDMEESMQGEGEIAYTSSENGFKLNTSERVLECHRDIRHTRR